MGALKMLLGRDSRNRRCSFISVRLDLPPPVFPSLTLDTMMQPNRMGLGMRPPMMGGAPPPGMMGYGPPGQGPPLSALAAQANMQNAPLQQAPRDGPKLTAFVGTISPGIPDAFLIELLAVSIQVAPVPRVSLTERVSRHVVRFDLLDELRPRQENPVLSGLPSLTNRMRSLARSNFSMASPYPTLKTLTEWGKP